MPNRKMKIEASFCGGGLSCVLGELGGVLERADDVLERADGKKETF